MRTSARGPGPGLPSIAALVPKNPEHGLKVIVAGRPDPKIPSDVAADHRYAVSMLCGTWSPRRTPGS